MKKKLTALLCAVFLVATFGFGQVRDKWLTKPFTEILELNKQLLVKELSSAPSHTSGWGTFYVLSSDGLAYFKDASGNAYDLTAAASGAPDSAHYLTDQVEAGLSAEVVVTANGKSLVTAANYAAMRTLLDLEPGVDYQAYNTVLTELTALTDPGADSFCTGLLLGSPRGPRPRH